MPDWSYHTLFRPLLFQLPAERARDLTLHVMGRLAALPLGPQIIELMGHMAPPPHLRVNLFGHTFASPVGLAAGLDPHHHGTAALARFGVGFIEAGPVTEEPAPAARPVQREDEAERLHYAAQPGSIGMIELERQLKRAGPLPVPLAIRLSYRPWSSAAWAAAERCRLMERLAGRAAFFTVTAAEGWSDEEWRAHIRRLVRTAHVVERPLLLQLPADLTPEEAVRLLEPAAGAGLGGLVIGPGTRTERGESVGPEALAPGLTLLRFLRVELGITLPIVAGCGLHEPADALALRAAGATLLQVHSGLVFSGPGLPKRINEALAAEAAAAQAAPPPVEAASPSPVPAASPGSGWIWGTLAGAGVLLMGLAALLIALTSVLLPYDETFTGLSRRDLDAINPRLLAFMAHDRISFAGAAAATGILHMYLAWFGMRQGVHWARQIFLVSGGVGGLSFLLFLGHGYFDPLHAVGVALWLPLFALALREHRSLPGPFTPVPDLRRDRVWRVGQWGQLLFVGLGAGILTSGLVIALIGITGVFVPQDLSFMQTTAAELREVNPRLVPLIAHDRAGFGGALVANGLAILLTALWGFRRGAGWIWWALFISGAPSYAAALWTHFAIGYTDFIHLLPVYVGLVVFALGLWASAEFLLTRVRSA